MKYIDEFLNRMGAMADGVESHNGFHYSENATHFKARRICGGRLNYFDYQMAMRMFAYRAHRVHI